MDSKNFLKGIYDDFFGIEKLKRENEKLSEELNIRDDYPKIELKSTEETAACEQSTLKEEQLKEIKNTQMANFFERIDKLYISQESKNVLKKIIEYIRKYSESIEKQYIPFNLCIYSNNNETIENITQIIADTVTFFSYVKKGISIEASFYEIEKQEQLNQIYNSKNSVILFKDIDGFISKNQDVKDKFLHRLEDIILEKPNEFVTILSSKNKETLDIAFDKNNDIKQRIFDFEIYRY